MFTNPQTLHSDAIVVDGHCDTLGAVLRGERTLGERSDRGHVDLPRLRAGGVTAQIFACFVPVDEYRCGAARHAMQRMDMLHQALHGMASRAAAVLVHRHEAGEDLGRDAARAQPRQVHVAAVRSFT